MDEQQETRILIMMRLRYLLALTLGCAASAAAQRAETGFLDRTVMQAGKPFRYQVYVPAAYASSNERLPVILFLHGAGERGPDGVVQTQVGIGTAIRRNTARFPAIIIMPQVPPDSVWIGGPADGAMAALDKTLSEFRT